MPDPDQPPAAPGPTSRTVALGILCMAGSVGVLAAMNMFIKLVGPDYSPFQAVFFRNAIAAVMVIPLVLRTGGRAAFRTDRPLGHVLRSLSGVLGNASFFYAYSHIALSDGMSIAMAVPIFTTLLAIFFLGEPVGARRWIAIVIGFVGVLIALDPTGDFQFESLFALSGTVFWALSLILIKKLAETENTYTIVFYYMITGVAVAACILPWVWVTPTPQHLIFYVSAGLVGGLGQVLMTFAMKFAPAAVVTPFEYTAICWAVLFDLTVWGVLPTPHTLIGAAVVIATGLYIWHRETRAVRRA